MTKNCYITSRDYKRLKELLDKGYEVVCFTTYEWDKGIYATDVCRARCDDGRYQIAARGIEYTAYWPGMCRYKSFEEACKKNSIEFIEPLENKNTKQQDIDKVNVREKATLPDDTFRELFPPTWKKVRDGRYYNQGFTIDEYDDGRKVLCYEDYEIDIKTLWDRLPKKG